MKRVIIVCEGPTEQAFCKTTLYPHFYSKGLLIQAPLIKHSRGGIVKWSILKKQIETHLFTDSNAFVTLLIDYYGLYSKYNFPNWEKSETIVKKSDRMNFLEQSMQNDLNETIRHRFIPYIQLHEFEGLIFNNLEIFKALIPNNDLVGIKELEETLSNYPNPEMINTNPETSPSHRLERIIKGYNKVVYGDILSESIGLIRIREKCPRFNDWIQKIENL